MPLFGPSSKKAYSNVATSRKHWEQEKIRAGKRVNVKVFVLGYGPVIDKAVKLATAAVADCERHGGVSDGHVEKLRTEFKKVAVISDKYRKLCLEQVRKDAANGEVWKDLSKVPTEIDSRFNDLLDAMAALAGQRPRTAQGPAARQAARDQLRNGA